MNLSRRTNLQCPPQEESLEVCSLREQWIDSPDAYKSATLAANLDVEIWALFVYTSNRLSFQVDSLSFIVVVWILIQKLEDVGYMVMGSFLLCLDISIGEG